MGEARSLAKALAKKWSSPCPDAALHLQSPPPSRTAAPLPPWGAVGSALAASSLLHPPMQCTLLCSVHLDPEACWAASTAPPAPTSAAGLCNTATSRPFSHPGLAL